jgi:hypothetical protein
VGVGVGVVGVGVGVGVLGAVGVGVGVGVVGVGVGVGVEPPPSKPPSSPPSPPPPDELSGDRWLLIGSESCGSVSAPAAAGVSTPADTASATISLDDFTSRSFHRARCVAIRANAAFAYISSAKKIMNFSSGAAKWSEWPNPRGTWGAWRRGGG